MVIDIILVISEAVLALALMYWGFHVSAVAPEFRAHRKWFLLLAAVVTVLTVASGVRAIMAQQSAAVAQEKNARVADSIRAGFSQNGSAFQAILGKLDKLAATQSPVAQSLPPKPLEIRPATARRKAISMLGRQALAADRAQTINQLRNLYVLSHDGISSEMLAGLELPPQEWLNEQLAKYGKPWRVKNIQGPNFEWYNVAEERPSQTNTNVTGGSIFAPDNHGIVTQHQTGDNTLNGEEH